ncbi:oligosaccharide flippase family protein [Poriferisphaera sp. WC338]|uniref:oligosaccharide flippase family protein n=1 Tax=Poriferisphaera sp. WC338 TaxID=3425129 RepID=UPI003D818F59
MNQEAAYSDSGEGKRKNGTPLSTGVSLKRRTVESAVTVAGGQFLSQIIRFAANLVLTRLIAPDIFGMMALIQTVVIGANMFSDMGVGANIINHKRGGEALFINTVWTVSVIRGFLLWLIIAVVSYPVSLAWGQTELTPMIIVVGLSYAILPFESPGMRVLCRNVQNIRPMAEEIITQLVSTSFIIITAYFWPSVWVLVIASLVRAFVHVGMTFAMWPGYKVWFAWDKTAIHDILHFGVWIFLSSGVAWILGYADKAILGGLVTLEEIGIYSIAFGLASMGIQIINKLGNNTLFPVYSRLADRGEDELRYGTFKIRFGILAATLPAVWVLAIFGEQIIELLYPEKYYEAGWMLRLVAIGAVGMVVNQTAASVLLAKRDSKRYMTMQCYRAVIYLCGVIAGGITAGLEGVIIGMIIAQWSEYPILVWAIRPHKVWLPGLDLSAFAISAAVIALGRFFISA